MVGHAGTGDETKVYPYASSLSGAELGLASLGLGSVPMGGYCDTPMIHHWQREPLELPPGSLQRVQVMGGTWGCSGRQPQECSGGGPGRGGSRRGGDIGVLAEFEQSICYVA